MEELWEEYRNTLRDLLELIENPQPGVPNWLTQVATKQTALDGLARRLGLLESAPVSVLSH